MNNVTDNVKPMTTTERGVRITVGLAVIAGVMMQTGTLGLAALLPIAAIYPLLTGFLGSDPVIASLKATPRTQGQPTHAALA